MYKYLRSQYARLVYFYPDQLVKNYFRIFLYLFLITFWFIFSRIIKSKKFINKDTLRFFILEDQRYAIHFENLKKNSNYKNKKRSFIIQSRKKIYNLEKFLLKKDVYKKTIFKLLELRNKKNIKVFICEIVSPDQVYFANILNLLGAQVCFIQHSEVIYNNYWKNFFPGVSRFYVRHDFMYRFLVENIGINRNQIVISPEIWNINFSNKEFSSKRIILIGQPLLSISEFYAKYSIDFSKTLIIIKNNIKALIRKSESEKFELIYIKHPRENINISDNLIIKNFLVKDLDNFSFYTDDSIKAKII